MRTPHGLALGLLLGLATLLPAGPPKQGRALTAEEQKEVARLVAEADRHLGAGRFEDAVKMLKRVVDYRAERQGASHGQVREARVKVEYWGPLTAVPAKDRAEVMRGLRLAGEGTRLQRGFRFREAEARHREALGIFRKVLGEQHAHTGESCNSVAFCLDRQGKYAEALALYQKGLAINCAVLGEKHPLTAGTYNALAACLSRQGKDARALPLYRKALAFRLEALGERHFLTATSYDNLGSCLNRLGRHTEALPLCRKALALRLEVLGGRHPDTAVSYTNVATCLDDQGRHAEALPLHQKALGICLSVLGERHPLTATSYNNVAMCLSDQGRNAASLPLFRKALALRLQVQGEEHPTTALAYNNIASCLQDQGKYAEALPLYEKALAIRLKVLGGQHPDVAQAYNNVASCLKRQRRYAEALPLYRKALALRLRLLGERHPDVAQAYNNVASCLGSQGKYAEALPLYQKALELRLDAEGAEHPSTAQGYHNVAFCLSRQRKYAEALPLYRKALALRIKVLGEQHPLTSTTYAGLAACLDKEGKHAEAARYWEKALLGAEWGRLLASPSGFDRSLYNAGTLSPRSALAACLVRLGKPVEAWRHAEADLARGLLDDLLPATEAAGDAGGHARLRQLDRILLPLWAVEKPSAEQVTRRDVLARERAALLTELADSAAGRLRARVLPLERIQKQLPADTALVFWLDLSDEHLGCVLRHQGPPAWVPLPGSGKEAWEDADRPLHRRVLTALADGQGGAVTRRRLLAQLHRQRLGPLEPHLKGVRRLLVVPAGAMTAVPVEALTDRYTVSYVPSASVFASRAEQHRPLQATSLLVLADPAFQRTAARLPPAPSHGLLIVTVTPRSLAARIGLRPGDVLLEYNGKELAAPADLVPPEGAERVPLRLWREGKLLGGRIPAGKLGVAVDKRPIGEALAAWRKRESDLLALGRGGDWQALPGTRLEARALAALVPGTTVLLGSDASQQKLAELAAADRLKEFRLLHLATHGQANPSRPRLTALILAQDHLEEEAPARAVLAGRRPLNGRLTVGTVLADWRLDADLVVLSACQTGLGTDTLGGEGMLGFTQALLQKGARSVVLSRWKVDDAATALLMARFYENLLGKRKGIKPMGRAAALAEAKAWLRGLSRTEATKRLAALVGGVPRGERGSIKAALPTRQPDAPKGEDRPFAAPYYWAAFILIGDPN